MIERKQKQLKLQDVIRIVSLFSRNDHEVGLAVADLINRGVVRVDVGRRNYHVVVR